MPHKMHVKIIRPLRRFFEWFRAILFGHDIFISYARRDAAFYATELGKRLQEKKLAVYLDQYASWPQRRIPREVLRELRTSRMMVVIGSDAALRSRAVGREARLFTRLRRAMVPIAIEPHEHDQAWTREPWRTIQGALREVEPKTALDQARVSPRVIERISSSMTFTTRAERQKRIATMTAIFVVISAAFVIVATRSAIRSAAAARSSTLAGESMIQGEKHPYLGLALAAAAYDAAPDRVSVDTRRALFTAINRVPGARRLFAPEELTRIGGGGFSDQDISAIAVTPDGATLIAGTGGGTISFRDIRSGAVLVHKAHPERVWGIAVSPSGRYAVTTALKNDVVLWDVSKQKQIAKFATPKEIVYPTPAFTSDGAFVVAGFASNSPMIAEWRVADVSRPVDARMLNLDAATCTGTGGGQWPIIALARDAPRLAVMLVSGKIVAVDWKTGQVLRCVPEPYQQTNLAFSPDGKRLGWITKDDTVIVVDVDSGREIHRSREAGDIVSLSINDRGQLAVASSSVVVYGGKDRLANFEYMADVAPISLAFHGESLFTGYRDETVAEWAIPPYAKPGPQLTYAKGDFDRVAFSQDGTQLIAGARDADTIFDVRTSVIGGYRKSGDDDFEAISGDGSVVAIKAKDALCVVEAKSKKVLKTIAIDDTFSRAALSFDGRDVAIGDSRGRIVLHHRKGERRIMRDEDQILALAISRRGELVAASTSHRTTVWDSRTGLSFATWTMPSTGLAFSPGGRLLASAHHTFLRVESLDPRVWRDIAHAKSPGAEAITAQRRVVSTRE